MATRVGCAGWSYPDWVGPVYPKGAQSGSWLATTARLFDTAEVDMTFYGLPEARTVAGWARAVRDAPGFTFSAKLPRTVTHEALPRGDLAASRRDTTVFLDRVVRPLEAAGRFEAVVVQLPPSFTAGPRGEDTALRGLTTLLGLLEPDRRRVAVEFRNPSWYSGRRGPLVAEAAAALTDLGVAAVQVDGLGSHFTPTRTAAWSYFRLHGRRRRVPVSERGERWAPYKYLYTHEEVAAIAQAVRAHDEAQERVVVIWNNHVGGRAARNAADLMQVLGRPRPRLPAPPPGTGTLDEYG